MTMYRGIPLSELPLDRLHEALTDVGTVYSAIAAEIKDKEFQAEVATALKDEYDPWDNGLVG